MNKLAALFFIVALVWGVRAEQPTLALHLDFNSLQLKREAVVKVLRSAAARGYNAILWEIEDKVKWETCPECVHPEAFTKAEFKAILAEAKRLGLAPIPLFQTFGHAEYVLMHGNHPEWMEKGYFYYVDEPGGTNAVYGRKDTVEASAKRLSQFFPDFRLTVPYYHNPSVGGKDMTEAQIQYFG